MVGKTLVGRKLAARLEWGCVSTDDLVDGILAVTTEQTHPQLHLLEQKDHRKYFVTRSVARMVADVEYRNDGLWPAMKKVIVKHAEWAPPVVLEGWHLMPEKVAQLGLPGILSLWLVADDEVLRQRVMEQSASFEQTSMAEELVRKFIDRSIALNESIREASEASGLAVVKVGQLETVEEVVGKCWEVVSGI
ncbi:MAG: cytidylate kinase-like family protein [Planctomycetes bacterium]|nr:cytidylate kinase-like family protein [Planctomycetota bacterium]